MDHLARINEAAHVLAQISLLAARLALHGRAERIVSQELVHFPAHPALADRPQGLGPIPEEADNHSNMPSPFETERKKYQRISRPPNVFATEQNGRHEQAWNGNRKTRVARSLNPAHQGKHSK